MIGETISHYRIIEKLGEGGMGVVYRAQDLDLDRPVALKFLPPDAARGREATERFLREARAAASLNHPGICTIHEIGRSDAGTFIAMECVDGRTVRDILASRRVTVEEALNIATQVAEALSAAHRHGIVHRDIKPSNIMLDRDGRARILDFGLARMTEATQLTRVGMTVGTVAYMSPEQARGEAVDHRTDLWSLGVVLYEMLAGKRPFSAANDQAGIYAILNSEPASLERAASPSDVGRASLGGISPAVARIVSRALAKDVRARYQSADEMVSDLKAARGLPTSGMTTLVGAHREELASVAVLPFQNMSPDPESDYFGDGLAEELAMALSRIRKLRVAARTSAFMFRGKQLDAREIGAALGVGAILEGSVRTANGRLRVTVKLVDASSGFQLWSERYDRDMEDVFAVQDDITLAIVRELRVRLDPESVPSPGRRPTDNLDAYALYLRGLNHWYDLTQEGLRSSRECYERAIEMDPDYALAHAALSMWHQSVAFWADVPPGEAFAKSREAALAALEIDDTVALAHNCLGVILSMHDWKWDEAEREFKRAIDLDFSAPFGHLNYAFHLSGLGRHEEAIEETRVAQRLDPLSTVVNTWAASRLLAGGLLREGTAALEEIAGRDPNAWQPHLWLSEALLYADNRDEAVREAERAAEIAGHLGVTNAFLASAYYLAGRRAQGERVLRELEDKARQGYVSPTLIARVHIARGSIPEAVDYAEEAFRLHDHWLQGSQAFAPAVRFTDPRLDTILNRIGLPVGGQVADKGSGVISESRTGVPATSSAGQSPASIAVMPFADMSPGKDQEYFCDGMSEEIINALTGIGGLRVIARTSAFAFKGKNEDVREIGRALDVSSILEGSVRKAGDRVRITAQLINVEDGSHVWSERYDRVLEDVFAVQDEIAAGIAQRLKLDLTDSERDRLAEERRVDPEAHDLYLRGRHVLTRGFFTMISPDETRVKKAIDFYERAVKVDPEYAAPHASLAAIYAARCRWVKPEGNCERARQEGARALELDDSSEGAHIAMSHVALSADLDWDSARSQSLRALELNPGSAIAQECCAGFFTWAAEFGRAIGFAKKALALDPLDYDAHLLVTFATGLSRRDYAESIELSEAALKLFPRDAYFESMALWSRAMTGVDVEKTAELYARRWPDAPGAGVLCAMTGLSEEARRVIGRIEKGERRGMRYSKARVHAALGEKDEALRLLEETWEREPRVLLQLNSDAELDCLRGEQRFKDLVKRSGIPMGELAYLSE